MATKLVSVSLDEESGELNAGHRSSHLASQFSTEPSTSDRSWGGWVGSFFGVDPAKEYRVALNRADGEDLSELEHMEFLQVGLKDKVGRNVVLLVGKNLRLGRVGYDQLYRYMVRELDEVVDEDYVLVYVHTQATFWKNCPGVRWLWRTFERLPEKYRSRMQKCYILHADINLWGTLMALGPLVRGGFYGKVEYVSRVEFLWDFLEKSKVELPEFVLKHDADLEDHPLMDYGIYATPADMSMHNSMVEHNKYPM